MLKVTAVNGTPVNDLTSPIVLDLKHADTAQAVAVASTIRQRANFAPAHDLTTLQALTQGFQVRMQRVGDVTLSEFNRMVYGLFDPDPGGDSDLVLSGVLHDDPDTTYTTRCRVLSFGQTQFAAWQGTFQWLEPVWAGEAVGPVTTSPLEVAGNTRTRPQITMTNGKAAPRRRITFVDTTGQSVAGWFHSVDVSGDGLGEHNYRVWLNNAPQPFKIVDGRLWFRVAVTAGHPSWADVVGSAAINNTDDAGMLQEAGLTLNSALQSGTATVDPQPVNSNSGAAALAWQPGVAGEHSENRRYTMGFDGDGYLSLLDTERTGRHVALKNDADSYILTSPIAMQSISGLKISAFAGYRRGVQAERNGVRMIKVTIADANGSPQSGPTLESAYPLYAGGRHPDRPYFAQFSMAGITFPPTKLVRSYVERPSGFNTFYSHDLWAEDYLPSEFGELARKYIGCTVINGPSGVWYLRFGPNAYRGGPIPPISMSILPKTGRFIAQTLLGDPESIFMDVRLGDASLDNVLSMYQEPVDPVTREPLGSGGDTTPAEDVYGVARVVIWYWTRESVDPIVAREWTIRGAGSSGDVPAQTGVTVTQGTDGLCYSIEPGTINIPGAVKVAVGLAPLASDVSLVDWGRMQIEEPVTVTLETAEAPSSTQVTVAGQILNGTLRNLTTGASLIFDETYSDSNGLLIDCETPAISGVGGAGMIYNPPRSTRGLRWFDLPGDTDVEWEATGDLADADISFVWKPRLLGEL